MRKAIPSVNNAVKQNKRYWFKVPFLLYKMKDLED